MTILQLKYAVTAADESSMRKASEKLFVSQPGLSDSIKKLESELGFKIFKRMHDGVTLTGEGSTFISYARKLVKQFEELEEQFSIRP